MDKVLIRWHQKGIKWRSLGGALGVDKVQDRLALAVK